MLGGPPNRPTAAVAQRPFVRIGWTLLLACLAGFAGQLRAAELRTVIFFGDSLTAGYGLGDPANEAYPALIQKKLTAAGLPWRVVNAGLSGETTAGGVRRVDWIRRQPADIFVVALGGNDGLRGLRPDISRTNLELIFDRVRAKYPAAKLVLAGMQMPREMGADFAVAFESMFPAVAEKFQATLIPFLLEHVGGRADLNQPDRIHPTAEGHAIIGETVWKALRPLL
ncbi:MAG: arylesterase [Opitutus sp.]|nr:arylesterase [Opitutus sp.]